MPDLTVSLGEERIFRIQPAKGRGKTDVVARQDTAFVLPYDSDRTFKHEVPNFARFKDRRISLTIRGFYGPGVE